MIPFNHEFLNKARKITSDYDSICGLRDLDSFLLHIVNEICEVKEKLRNKGGKYGKPDSDGYKIFVGEEVADVFLTTIALTNYLRMTNEQINHFLNSKLMQVEERVRLYK